MTRCSLYNCPRVPLTYLLFCGFALNNCSTELPQRTNCLACAGVSDGSFSWPPSTWLENSEILDIKYQLLIKLFFASGLSIIPAMLQPQTEEEPGPGTMEVTGTPGTAPSPQSEAVTSELQELSLQPAPNLLPLQERKNGETVMLYYIYFSLICTHWCLIQNM